MSYLMVIVQKKDKLQSTDMQSIFLAFQQAKNVQKKLLQEPEIKF